MYDIANGTQAAGSTVYQITVGSGSAGSPQGVAIGDVIVVGAGSGSGSGQSATVTDSQSHTYTLGPVAPSGAGQYAAIFTATASHALVAGTDWIKVTYGQTGGYKPVVIKGITGASSGTPDQTNAAAGTSTTPDAGGTGVLAQASEVVVGLICSSNSGGQPTGLSTGGTGVTAHTGTSPYACMFYENVNSTAATDASGTISPAAGWTALVATFKLTASTALTVTSTSPPSGTKGTAYNSGTPWPMTSTGGTSPVTWSITSGTLPPGLYFSVNEPGHICGLTMRKGTGIVAENTKWGNLPTSSGYGIYPITLTKIYQDELGSYPTFATAALWISNGPAHIAAALSGGYQMILLFDNPNTGTTDPGNWPGGAIMPSNTVMNTSLTGMQNTVTSLLSACASQANGSGIAAVCFWNEVENKGQPFQQSYQYKYFYASMKSSFPHVPIWINYIWYYHASETPSSFALRIAQCFPGPSPTQPAGWGDGKLYCDGIVTDIYAGGPSFDAGNLGARARYWYAEPDMYTPPAGPGLAGSGIPGPCDIADYNNITWGNIETGNTASSAAPSLTTMQNYLVGTTPLVFPPGSGAMVAKDVNVHSLYATYQQRINNDLPIVGACWYESLSGTGAGLNDITSASDPRNPYLAQVDAATAQANPGNISGTPTQNGTFPFTITATDKNGNEATANVSIVIGTGSLTLSITTPAGALTNGASNTVYSGAQIMAQGGTTPYTFTLNSGSLSGSGLTLSGGGIIAGTCATVSVATTYTFTVKVTDAASNTATSGTYTITIQPSSVNIQITNTSPLAGGKVGQQYAQNFTITGGTGPYTVALASSSPPLPPGLSVDNNDPIDDNAGNPLLDNAGGNLS